MSKKKRKKKPAKKPPKKSAPEPQRKAKRVPIKGERGQPTKTQVTFDDAHLVGLRYAAAKDYACTFKDVSVAELCQRPMYAGISQRTMERWCTEDGWVEHRRAFREEYRKGIEKAIGTQLVQTRLEYMKRGEEALDRLFNKLVPKDEQDMMEPTSLESLVNATRQFWDKVIEEKEKLADAIMPEPIAVQQSENYVPAVRPQLSQSEARAAALTIVRMRRDQIRAALKAEEAATKGEEPEKPHMRVIDGEK